MRKKNEITEYVAAALIFVCAVAVSLGIFLVCTQNSIERNSQKVIKTNVSRQSEHIKAILDIHYGYLRGIAKEIGKSEELVSDENMEMLISLEEETALERTALIEADGTAHYDNGAEKNVSSRRYFKEGMEGKETLSDPLESSVDKETRVILLKSSLCVSIKEIVMKFSVYGKSVEGCHRCLDKRKTVKYLTDQEFIHKIFYISNF